MEENQFVIMGRAWSSSRGHAFNDFEDTHITYSKLQTAVSYAKMVRSGIQKEVISLYRQ